MIFVSTICLHYEEGSHGMVQWSFQLVHQFLVKILTGIHNIT